MGCSSSKQASDPSSNVVEGVVVGTEVKTVRAHGFELRNNEVCGRSQGAGDEVLVSSDNDGEIINIQHGESIVTEPVFDSDYNVIHEDPQFRGGETRS